MDLQQVKQRFGIIGNSPLLNRSIDIAVQVAPTDLSVLITGESGTGKEVFPQIIHHYSARKHGSYIAVNCGAIPEGTIDSELFGHEKGSFTGASDQRKGYFEVAGNGTIFLDEIGELPLNTQVRLLRVLETGEFIKVGSSKVQKSSVRLVAATNVNLAEAIQVGRFREDLFYRLNTVPILVPPLRERREDIFLLFRKFASDFAQKYRMPPIQLDVAAQEILMKYHWPGNVRQLKNITEQISIIERERMVDAPTLTRYLPTDNFSRLPALVRHQDEKSFGSEREILYQVLFDMRRDMNDLKKLVNDLMDHQTEGIPIPSGSGQVIKRMYPESYQGIEGSELHRRPDPGQIQDTEEVVEEVLSLDEKESETIRKALDKFKGKRRFAAQELGISERTLYRKMEKYGID